MKPCSVLSAFVSVLVLLPSLPIQAGTVQHPIGGTPRTTSESPSELLLTDSTRSAAYFTVRGDQGELNASWSDTSGAAAVYSVTPSATTTVLVTSVAASHTVYGEMISPDGNWFVYRDREGEAWSVPTSGGPPVRLMDGSSGLQITGDSQYVISQHDGAVFGIPISGGTPTLLTPAAWLSAGGRVAEVRPIPGSDQVILEATNSSGADEQLYRVAADGTGMVALTSVTSYIAEWDLNGDSSRVVYLSDGILSSVRLTTSPSTTLLRNSGSVFGLRDFAIHPDGTEVAFIENGRVYSMAISGGTITDLVTSTSSSVAHTSDPHLTYSADASHLVFAKNGTVNGLASLPSGGGAVVDLNTPRFISSFDVFFVGNSHVAYLDDEDGDGKDDIVSVNLATGTHLQLSRASLDSHPFPFDLDNYAALSPDGDSLIYVNDDITRGKDELYVAALDGSTERQLDLSAGTSSVADFFVDAVGNGVFFREGSIYWVDLSTSSAAVELVSTVAAPSSHSQPLLSLTGAYVVYSAWEGDPTYQELYLSAADGTNRSVVATTSHTSHVFSDVQFTSDESWLLYRVGYSSSGGQVHGYRISDGLSVQLSDPSKDVLEYVLSRDESQVFLVKADAVDNLYAVPLDGTSSGTNLTSSIAADVRSYDMASSPMGTWLVFQASGFYLAAADGSGTPILISTDTSVSSSDILFSTDESKLWFEDTSSGTPVLTEYDLSSGSYRTLHTAAATSSYFGEIQTSATDYLVFVEWSSGPDPILYSVELSTGTVVELLNVDTDQYEEYSVLADGSAVICLADPFDTGIMQLWSYPMTGGAPTRLNGNLAAGGDVESFLITPDETTVVYRADQVANERYELFQVAVTGGTVSRIGNSVSADADVLEGEWSIASDAHVVFLSDDGAPGYARVFAAPIHGGPQREITDMTMAATTQVGSLAVAENGSRVAFLANPTDSRQWTAFTAWGEPDLSPIGNPVSLMNSVVGPIGFTVSDAETPATDLTVQVSSSNAALLDPNDAVIGGTGMSRTLTLTPQPDAWGETEVTLTVSDGFFSTESTLVWRVTPDPNDAPTGLSVTPNSVPENKPSGTAVGTLHGIDPDAWDTHSFALVSGGGDADNGLFHVDGTTLRTTGAFDYELRTSFSIRLRVADWIGAWHETPYTIQVQDLAGAALPLGMTTREGLRAELDPNSFINRFALLDGGALKTIRIDSAPANGTLLYRLGRREIDPFANGVRRVVSGDVNGDGRVDVVAAVAGSKSVVWYENTGTGTPTFTYHLVGASMVDILDVDVGDMNKDGALDIIVAVNGDNRIWWFENSGGTSPTFTPHSIYLGSGGVSSVAVVDIDADGDMDVIGTHPGAGQVLLHRNDGLSTPGFLATVLSGSETFVSDAQVGDVDGDGDLDVVSVAYGSGNVVWFEQAGPNFNRIVIAFGTSSPTTASLADLNGDARLDIVVSTAGNHSVGWYENAPPSSSGGLPTFTHYGISNQVAAASFVHAGDVNGDSIPDVLASSPTDGLIMLFENHTTSGVTSFSELELDLDAQGAQGVAVADFNLNGRPDVVSCSPMANLLAWYEDERHLIGGDEVAITEVHKVAYHPGGGFTGQDTFGWRGFDGLQWSFSPATVTIHVYNQEYWDWLVAAYGEAVVRDFSARATTWGPFADTDGDGRANLLEYAFGTNPNDGSDTSDSYAVGPETDTDGNIWIYITFIIRNDPNLTYTPQVSTDLTTWNGGASYFAHEPPDVVIDATFTEVTYRYLVPVTSSSATAFFRIHVESAVE